MSRMYFPSYAKINLGLHIRGKRADGYHEIETILQQIDLKDEICFELRKDSRIKLRCNDSTLPTDSSNLCVRAAKLLQESARVNYGVDIELKKNVPVGAGLGGGSSNAAVTLLALNRLWNLNLSSISLEALAPQLGSDIPFFIKGGRALATGRGEQLEPQNMGANDNNIWVLVVFPMVQIPTQWAYQNLNLSLTNSKKDLIFSSFKDKNFNDVDFITFLVNDFEETVFVAHPALASVKEKLYERGAKFASLSGSGSALFGFFGTVDELESAKQSFPNYRTFKARFVRWGYSEIN